MLPQSTPVVSIPLSQGKTATIDASDAARVLVHKWRVKKDRTVHRAVTTIARQEIQLHRFILDPAADMAIHFLNGDALDCRRANMVVRSRADVARESGRQNKGEHNGQWKGDAAEPTTKRDRARRRFALDGQCQACNKAPATDRHHRDGNPGNNAPENILLCCRRCHMKQDGRLAAFLAYPRPKGVDHPGAKLSAKDLVEIRALLAQPEPDRTGIARRYGVTWSTIDHICKADPELAARVSNLDNAARRYPERLARGSTHHEARLTEDKVREIRARYAAGGTSYARLAREYGVAETTIRHVIRRMTWQHVS